jgi:6,7-dimethyl-8-ribityllumazine synthase
MVYDKAKRGGSDLVLQRGPGVRVLILEAPYYQEVTQELITGATAVLDEAKVGYDRFAVTGALELPQAFAAAVAQGLFADAWGAPKYSGVVVLGCVIQGETSHYDIVCTNTNHWLMDIAISHKIPLGNAVLTVDTHEQALTRARGGADGKGGDAARACLRLMWLAANFGKHSA